MSQLASIEHVLWSHKRISPPKSVTSLNFAHRHFIITLREGEMDFWPGATVSVELVCFRVCVGFLRVLPFPATSEIHVR